MSEDDLLHKLQCHIAQMAPHQAERNAGQLLIQAAQELKELRDLVQFIGTTGAERTDVIQRAAKFQKP